MSRSEAALLRLGAALAAVLVVAGTLPGDFLAAEVVSDSLAGVKRTHLDQLSYALPPFVAAAVLAAMLVSITRPSALTSATSASTGKRFVAAASVLALSTASHALGIVRLVDRSPSRFPWVACGIVGAVAVVGILVATARAVRSDGARRWGWLVLGHGLLFADVAVFYGAMFFRRAQLAYGATVVATLALVVLGASVTRATSSDTRPGLGVRVAGGAAIAFAVAAVPLWPRLDTVRSRYVDHETCGHELALDRLWRVFPHRDSVCPSGRAYVVAAVYPAMVLVLLGVWVYRRRRTRR